MWKIFSETLENQGDEIFHMSAIIINIYRRHYIKEKEYNLYLGGVAQLARAGIS